MSRDPSPQRRARHRASCDRFLLALVLASLCIFSTLGAAAPVRTAHVEAELVAAETALVPGRSTAVALRLKLAPGWHTYWLNPGDSGLPTTLAWKLPAGVSAGPIQWPAPRALPAGPLVNFGYEGEVLHVVDISTASDVATAAALTLNARADWLVCKETCIPEGADLALTFPVGASAAPDPRWAAPIAAARAALPRPLEGWDLRADAQGPRIRLTLAPKADDPSTARTLRFFPFEPDRIEPSLPQQTQMEGPARVLTLPVSSAFKGAYPRVAGVLAAAEGITSGAGLVMAATIDVPLSGAIVAGPKPSGPAVTLDLEPPAPASTLSLAAAVLLALGGGLLLNLMPCVFPVLSLKVLGFAAHHDRKATMHAEALAFAAGVLLTFLVLGFVLFGLRAAGEHLGWGFQLQSPAVVTALALLFFALALNLSGVFEFGQLAPSGVAGWTARSPPLDAFGSGVLAVVIASPCTAPFMGAALGYALAGNAATLLAVFTALGVGMALPYVLLAWFPSWRRHVPRSGPWLAHVKQLLAFPLYGTVIWLVWVLGAQRDNDSVVRLLFALLALGFVLWTWRIVRGGGARRWLVAGLAALAAGTIVAAPLFVPERDVSGRATGKADPQAGDGWDVYTPAKLSELQAAGRTVFVDFTAAWCVTCQVNKRLVLDRADTRAAFERANVALLRADWTRRDGAITEALARLGRNGVPVYVVYRPGRPPQLLPEILDRQVVLEAVGT